MDKLNEREEFEKRMKEFADYYENYMEDESEGFELFYKYGPLTDKYWKYEPRILVCNLESYDDDKEGIVTVDINIFKEWAVVPTSYNTARFITGLIKKLNKENVTDIIPFKNISKQEYLIYMENISYMNFRLSAGKFKPADINGINNDVDAHSNYLIQQINLLNADIIIIGGKTGCDIYNKLFETTLKYNTTSIINDKVICSIKHFSRPNYQMYNEKINEIIKCLEIIQSEK